VTAAAVLICGHGSRDPEAIAEFELVAAALRPRLPDFDFATGHIEFARPTIHDGLTGLAVRGARQILAIPGMLLAASHVKNDLPWEMSFMADNPGIDVRLGRDFAMDPKLLRAAADRIAAAADLTTERAEALLVGVGRGTNDPDANSNISKLARMLWEGMGFGWAEVAFSGVAHPRVDIASSARRKRHTTITCEGSALTSIITPATAVRTTIAMTAEQRCRSCSTITSSSTGAPRARRRRVATASGSVMSDRVERTARTPIPASAPSYFWPKSLLLR
jgi:sirohydrochlorin ferrochelatase